MKNRLALALLIALLPLPLPAVEIKKDGWLFPNPARASKKAVRTADTTDRIAGKETVVRIYQRQDGVVFETLEIDGEIFACQFHVKGEEGKAPTVYAIVDTDGDGVFESKFAAGEAAATPEWVMQRYFKKHPNLHDPGPHPAPGQRP